MADVFVGSEAVAQGRLGKSDLRRHRAMFRDVYMPKSGVASLHDRAVGAWLWSRRRAIVAGVAASALHGAQWVDPDVRIELIAPNARAQPGLMVRNETLADDEITEAQLLPVTTPARTAYDLGRHQFRGQAVARLDALMRATPFSVEDVFFDELALEEELADLRDVVGQHVVQVTVGGTFPRAFYDLRGQIGGEGGSGDGTVFAVGGV